VSGSGASILRRGKSNFSAYFLGKYGRMGPEKSATGMLDEAGWKGVEVLVSIQKADCQKIDTCPTAGLYLSKLDAIPLVRNQSARKRMTNHVSWCATEIMSEGHFQRLLRKSDIFYDFLYIRG
jgi:hypothetical protein